MGDESKWRNRRFCGSPEGSVEVSGPLRLHCMIYDGTNSPCCAIFFSPAPVHNLGAGIEQPDGLIHS